MGEDVSKACLNAIQTFKLTFSWRELEAIGAD